MNGAHSRYGWAWRGLVALGITATVAVVAGLAGVAFSLLEKMPAGGASRLYTFGVIAAAATITVVVIIGGSRLFLRGGRDGGSAAGPAAAIPAATADGGETTAPGRRGNFGFILILVLVFNIYLDFMNRGGEFLQRLLSLEHLPFTLSFALGVTPIMGLLAVAERPRGARIKWRTVIFTAALWPVALLADMIAPAAASFHGPAQFVVAYSGIIVMVCWIALGAAIGTLDVMFCLSDSRRYEEKMKGLLPLAEGWRLWHGAAFVAVYFGLRWLDRVTAISAFEGNVAFIAALLAAGTIALSRPREARGWVAACLAGAAAAALLLGGAVIAGRVIELAGAGRPEAHLAAYLFLALPAIAVAVVAVIRLSPPPDEASRKIAP